MKIRIEELPKDGLTLNIDEDVELINQILKETEGIGSYFTRSIHADLFLYNNNSVISVKGKVEGDISLPCSRCLKDFTLHLSPEIDINLYPKEKAAFVEETELSDEDMDVGYYEDEIDISEIMRENLFLEIPLKPLCDINCKGLCPKCGINLNEEECLCFVEEEKGDLRFGKLKELMLILKEK